MNNSFNSQNLPPQAKEILKNNGIDPTNSKVQNADKLLSSLNEEDAKKVNSLLNDKEALNRLLNSQKAQEIIKQLFGNNGAK